MEPNISVRMVCQILGLPRKSKGMEDNHVYSLSIKLRVFRTPVPEPIAIHSRVLPFSHPLASMRDPRT